MKKKPHKEKTFPRKTVAVKQKTVPTCEAEICREEAESARLDTSEMQGKYFHMQEYIDSYLVGRGEYDAKNFLTMDQDLVSIDPEGLYRNSFTRIKNLVNMGTEKRQTRAKTRNNEDIEAGSRNI